MKTYWGIDCGSTEIKIAACDGSGKILHLNKKRTLFPLIEHVRIALQGDGKFPSPWSSDFKSILPGHRVVATGYGRSHIQPVDEALTEIKSHALGVEHQTQHLLSKGEPYTIIDIGGQDSKVISIKSQEVNQFSINRKCAAGTGAFIEELAHRLELKIEQLPELEKNHDSDVTLNSYCTVFAGQEVIKVLMNGEKLENLIHSLYQSVVKRVLEMTSITTKTIVFSGGVLTHHAPLERIFQQKLGGNRNIIIAPHAQFCGAIGAAIHGIRTENQSRS